MMNNPYRIGMQVPYGYPVPSYPSPTTASNKMMPTMPSGVTMAPSTTPTTVTPTMPPAGLAPALPGVNVSGQLPMEESFIENILRLNLGKQATLYMTYENNSEWNAKIFKGRLEAAGRDHIIISDPATGMRFLLLMVNLDYITFDEELQYYYPFAGGKGPQGR